VAVIRRPFDRLVALGAGGFESQVPRTAFRQAGNQESERG
jgi:hypothetical protein